MDPALSSCQRTGEGLAFVPGMLLPRFEYASPATVAEAARLLAEVRGEAVVLAGGTDLLVKMKRRLLKPRLVVSLKALAELRRTGKTAGGLMLGSLVTMAELALSPDLSGPFAALAEGAGVVGGPIVRNRATLGGNVVNARPCADTASPLIVLGARLHLEGPGGRRTLDADGFITGPGRTLIRPDEILTSIELPAPASKLAGSAYLKLTRRAAMEVTIVGCAAAIDLEDDRRTVKKARLAFTSVAPVPLRTPDAEREVEGKAADEAAIGRAATAARAACRPIDDQRAPGAYRSEMVEVLARRALRAALTRAGGRA